MKKNRQKQRAHLNSDTPREDRMSEERIQEALDLAEQAEIIVEEKLDRQNAYGIQDLTPYHAVNHLIRQGTRFRVQGVA